MWWSISKPTGRGEALGYIMVGDGPVEAVVLARPGHECHYLAVDASGQRLGLGLLAVPLAFGRFFDLRGLFKGALGGSNGQLAR